MFDGVNAGEEATDGVDLHEEAPRQGPTLNLLYTLFTGKVPISYTFQGKMLPLDIPT